MTESLTLAEMAERLKVSPKTLRKYVRERDIPHIALGRSLRFDPVTVNACLRAVAPDANPVVKFSPVVAKSNKSKFAEAVGV